MTLQEKAYKSIDAIRCKSDSAILFCSLGKDSLVLLDMLYPKFERIVCVFMFWVNGLSHIEKWVKWVKSKYPKIEFVKVPHWNLSYILKGGLYCVPNPNIKLVKLKDVIDAMRLRFNIYYVFLGMKKADGMNRRLMLNRYESSNYENNGICYPLAEFTQKEILSYMRHHDLPSPVRYGNKASNGLGFNLDCFLWMRENCPEDLEIVYKTFPMSRRILFEYDLKNGRDLERY